MRNTLTRTGYAAAVLGLVGAALLAAVAPANATGDRDRDPVDKPPYHVDCVPVIHGTDGLTVTAGGKYAFDPAGGLILTTAANPDAVHWKTNLTTPVSMDSVYALRYSTRKLDDGKTNPAALPAYRIFLSDVNGGAGNTDNTTTLVYEPYWQIPTAPKLNTTETWDVRAGRFWATKNIAGVEASSGGPGEGQTVEGTLVRWDVISAKNPNAKVVAIGVGQGTWNAGTQAWVNHVVFKTKKLCNDHVWVKPKTTPTPTPTQTQTVPPRNDLPVTGISWPTAAGIGALLIVVGAGLVRVLRRRRLEFTAP